MGFEGMGCIHPVQIEIIHRAFAPAANELEKALTIVAAYEEAQARGLGVVSLGSKMIDAPVVQRAVKLVARARKMGIIADACGRQENHHERGRSQRLDHKCCGPSRANPGQRPRSRCHTKELTSIVPRGTK